MPLRGGTEEALAAIVVEKDGSHALPKFYYLLMGLAGHRIMSYSVVRDGRRLATLSPSSASFSFTPAPLLSEAEYVLSRFAYVHRKGEEMVMESPLSHGTITLYGWEAAVIAVELAKAQPLSALSIRLPEVPPATVALFLGMLVSAGFACEIKAGETCPEEKEGPAQWEFHDLLFHSRSRLGRHNNPYGATYPFYKKIEPLPAVKPPVGGEAIPLCKPDMDALKEEDFPFTLVLEERKSIREYGREPITAGQLGEFLFRAARVKAMRHDDYQELSRRPYPGGGAIYELELYLTVNTCRDIPSGLYHYCPARHVIEKISGMNRALDALLDDAKGSAGLEEKPQILIAITARFPRLSWKYESIAYSVLLKDVGVVYQTMYLVATAMDLAPCALGGGDSDLFAEAARLDYYGETSVGEFLLGSKRV